MKNVGLVVGGSGIVGRAFIEDCDQSRDWSCISISRRVPKMETSARLLSVDALDPKSVDAHKNEFRSVTHIFFTAYLKREKNADEVVANIEALKNIVSCVEEVSPGLRHVQLMQGSKWYGCHLGPYRTPAREEDPPHPMPIFYHGQQAWLEERKKDRSWTWSALRPHGIWGMAIGSELSHMNTIAVYATIMKHLGQPLHFPGKPGAYDAVYQCTEASLLAKAMKWAGTSEAAANNAFNITNGDFIRWKHAWPLIAKWFGMEVGEPLSMDLALFVANRDGIWEEIAQKHKLKYPNMRDLTTIDNSVRSLFNSDWDQMSSVVKAQELGWSEVRDTYKMIPRQLDRLAREGVIPPWGLKG